MHTKAKAQKDITATKAVVAENIAKAVSFSNLNSLFHRYSFYMHQQQTAFENIVEKREIAHKEQFLLFPQYFLLNQIIVYPFVHIFDIISSFAAESEQPKIGISGKRLTLILLFAIMD